MRNRYRSITGFCGLGLALAGILVLVMAALAGCGSSGPASLAPDFSGVTLDGTDVSLAGYRGKPVLLAFMASW